MTFRVKLKPSDHQFDVEGRDTILRAGLNAGLNLAHNCMNGSCGGCTARLLDGEIEQTQSHDYQLTEQQKQEGEFLTCCYQPTTDLELQMHEKHDAVEIPFQEIIAKVAKIERLQDDVVLLQVRTPRSKVLDFLAGQRTSLCLPDGSCSVLGIASCPCDGMNLRFHLRHDDSRFSDQLFNHSRKGQQVMLFGPVGDFTLNEFSDRPLVFIAWESGFAQVQSLIDHAISINPDRQIALYWLSAIDRGHYLSNYCRAWRDTLDNFCYESIDLAPAGDDTLDSALHKLASQQQALDQSEVYAILPATELATVRRFLLETMSLPAEQFRGEAMTSAV